MKINISSRTLLACLNKSKPSDCSRPDDDGCLPGVAIEIAWGVGAFACGPRIPKRLIADGASGISCCIILPLNTLSGKVGGAEGFGIGGADLGVDSIPASISARRASGDDAEGVPTSDADLLVAGVKKSANEDALLFGRDAEGIPDD